MTCWRRLRDWHEADLWQLLLYELHAAWWPLDWHEAVIDSWHVRALKGGPTRAEPGRPRRPGWKQHVITEARGIPLAAPALPLLRPGQATARRTCAYVPGIAVGRK